MANRTNKPNRTFSRSCSVCSGSAPHRTEPNSTLVRFGSSGFRTLITFVRFCSNRTRTEQYSCPFVFGKFGLLKAESRSLHSAASGLIPGLESHIIKNGRGSSEEQCPKNNGRRNNDRRNSTIQRHRR